MKLALGIKKEVRRREAKGRRLNLTGTPKTAILVPAFCWATIVINPKTTLIIKM
jgi:hypothetical protein